MGRSSASVRLPAPSHALTPQVLLRAASLTPPDLAIVLEFADHGSLDMWVRGRSKALPRRVLLRMMQSIASGTQCVARTRRAAPSRAEPRRAAPSRAEPRLDLATPSLATGAEGRGSPRVALRPHAPAGTCTR